MTALQDTLPPITATPATAWTTGQYVQTGTAGAPGEAHWDSTDWVAGQPPDKGISTQTGPRF